MVGFSYHWTLNTIFKLLVELDDKNEFARGISLRQWTDQGIYIFSNTARFKNMRMYVHNYPHHETL